MGCTHEMKLGSVVTVINAGGVAGGCSLCRSDALETRLTRLESVLREIREHATWDEEEHDDQEPDEDDMSEALTKIHRLTEVLFE